MEESTEKLETDSHENEPPTSPSSVEKLFWWGGGEVKFEDIIDL